jgi:hypothetical protein
MEIVCGEQTSLTDARRVLSLARRWGKEPSLLRRDIRGFITNRIMYAMLREAFYLVESGYATIADVDRSLRNDLGYWITFAGPFHFMDLTGIPAYAAVMQSLFPELNCGTKVPDLMKKVVASGARGVSNAKGFYRCTPAQALRWEKQFLKFSYEIRRLARRYAEGNPTEIGSSPQGERVDRVRRFDQPVSRGGRVRVSCTVRRDQTGRNQGTMPSGPLGLNCSTETSNSSRFWRVPRSLGAEESLRFSIPARSPISKRRGKTR